MVATNAFVRRAISSEPCSARSVRTGSAAAIRTALDGNRRALRPGSQHSDPALPQRLVSSPSMLQWDDLQYFLAILRTGTMSAAARSLKVNQTTVARRLGALEEELGVLLFDRTPEGFRVTAAGQKIIGVASQMEEAALSVGRLAAGVDEKLAGMVRLACSETLACHYLLSSLSRFRAAHPRITIELVTGNPPINLVRREADLAIRAIKPNEGDLVVRKLADAGWFLYSARDAGPSDGQTPFEEQDVVSYDGELAGIPPAQWIAQHVAPEHVAIRCNSILSAAAAIGAGIGFGTLPAFIGDRHPALRRMRPDSITTQKLLLVVHPDMQHQARVRALSDFLVDTFSGDRALFAG